MMLNVSIERNSETFYYCNLYCETQTQMYEHMNKSVVTRLSHDKNASLNSLVSHYLTFTYLAEQLYPSYLVSLFL